MSNTFKQCPTYFSRRTDGITQSVVESQAPACERTVVNKIHGLMDLAHETETMNRTLRETKRLKTQTTP